MYKKVLLPVSDKTHGQRSHKALQHALGLNPGEIIVLHVTQPLPNTVGGEARAELKENDAAKGQALVCAVVDELQKTSTPFRSRVEEGTPVETIIRVAHEEDADIIVMFTDGRDDLKDILIGSITERVLRQTDIPLLAVRR